MILRSWKVILAVLSTTTVVFTSSVRASIIDSATENVNQGKISLGEGGAACNKLENTTAPIREGQRAFKHLVDKCGERSEFEFDRTNIGDTYWQSWSMYLPSNWADSNDWYDIVAQWPTYPPSPNRKFKEEGCGAVGSKMSIKDDTLRFDFQHKGDILDTQCDKYPLGNIDDMKGKWVDFVMHVKWTGNSDGFLKLWMKMGNEAYVQKVNYEGATYWSDEGSGPYFKMGLYKGDPNWPGPGAPRVLYTDNYKLGDANSSFAEVTPDASDAALPTANTVRVEAEDMTLTNYQVFDNSDASGEKAIKLPKPTTSGTASTTFSGSSGLYNIVLGYFDENDGEASLQVKRQNSVVASLNLNQNLGGSGTSAQTLTSKQVASNVQINYGDKIQIEGIANQEEWARVDYIKFIPVSSK